MRQGGGGGPKICVDYSSSFHDNHCFDPFDYIRLSLVSFGHFRRAPEFRGCFKE